MSPLWEIIQSTGNLMRKGRAVGMKKMTMRDRWRQEIGGKSCNLYYIEALGEMTDTKHSGLADFY